MTVMRVSFPRNAHAWIVHPLITGTAALTLGLVSAGMASPVATPLGLPHGAAEAATATVARWNTTPTATAVLPRSNEIPGSITTEDVTDRTALVDLRQWDDRDDWRDGTREGITVLPGRRTGMLMLRGVGETVEPDATGTDDPWEYATWTSEVVDIPFAAEQLVASWNASTPGHSRITVEVQATYDDGTATPWYALAHWTSEATDAPSTSVDGQDDGRSAVLADTIAMLSTDAGQASTFDAYQMRITMRRPAGSLVMPRVWLASVMASAAGTSPERTATGAPGRATVDSATPEIPSGGAAPDAGASEEADGDTAEEQPDVWGTELAVPRRSTAVHHDAYPELGGGSEWSSPAATTMVMEYFGAVPSRSDMAWIDPGYRDPQVAHAARMAWDASLHGTGNWSFNTAYAASSTDLEAFVTRLRSLTAVEAFIEQGIPLVVSLSFDESELAGAGYSSSGHAMVVTGFTESGDVVVNDPAARSNEAARRVYDRSEFERAWQRPRVHETEAGPAEGPGGIAYVIRPRTS